ncbi:MAG: hypothetical protein A2Y15_06160 [Clostridiales bacterium GWF2_36_10]|nr:MAG: hypothetical protein A2Y15_06160 [Clostridiales bacterium GWF2_36_10]HAN21900.1 hypothetical protein [Clostridiales bacterium]
MNQNKLKIIKISVISIAVITVIINTISYFFLPDTIVTQLFSSGKRTSTLTYLLIIPVMVAVSSVMTVFSDKKTKWFFISVVLSVMNVIFIIINLLNLV